MANNSTNTNNTNNYLSPQITEPQKDHEIWQYNSWIGLHKQAQAQKCGEVVKPVNWIPILPFIVVMCLYTSDNIQPLLIRSNIL